MRTSIYQMAGSLIAISLLSACGASDPGSVGSQPGGVANGTVSGCMPITQMIGFSTQDAQVRSNGFYMGLVSHPLNPSIPAGTIVLGGSGQSGMLNGSAGDGQISININGANSGYSTSPIRTVSAGGVINLSTAAYQIALNKASGTSYTGQTFTSPTTTNPFAVPGTNPQIQSQPAQTGCLSGLGITGATQADGRLWGTFVYLYFNNSRTPGHMLRFDGAGKYPVSD